MNDPHLEPSDPTSPYTPKEIKPELHISKETEKHIENTADLEGITPPPPHKQSTFSGNVSSSVFGFVTNVYKNFKFSIKLKKTLKNYENQIAELKKKKTGTSYTDETFVNQLVGVYLELEDLQNIRCSDKRKRKINSLKEEAYNLGVSTFQNQVTLWDEQIRHSTT